MAVKLRTLQSRHIRTAYMFLGPILIYFAIVNIFPIFHAFYLSLHKVMILKGFRFEGLNNYVRFFQDEVAWISIKNTFYFTILWVPSVLICGLLLALFLNRDIAFKRLFRAFYFTPVITSMVAVSILWKWFYQPNFGLFNVILKSIGLPEQMFLDSEKQVLPSIALMGVWKSMGFYMVIFLAGLQNIPRIFYEAAITDGARPFQQFRYITMPLLKDTTFFTFVIAMIQSWQVFTSIYVMTSGESTGLPGGPMNASRVMVLYIYDYAFRYFKLGYACSAAFVLFAILMLFMLIQLRFYRYQTRY